MLEGNKVWEIVPFQVRGKGEAVRRVLATMPRPCLPIYVGDDQQDEPAFALLRRGITVRVGQARRSRARYRLQDSDQVRYFLERLAKELS
jgi:trehalose-phosphatase